MGAVTTGPVKSTPTSPYANVTPSSRRLVNRRWLVNFSQDTAGYALLEINFPKSNHEVGEMIFT